MGFLKFLLFCAGPVGWFVIYEINKMEREHAEMEARIAELEARR